MKALLQSALDVALSVVRANPTVLEGLGAHLQGDVALLLFCFNFCYKTRPTNCQEKNVTEILTRGVLQQTKAGGHYCNR